MFGKELRFFKHKFESYREQFGNRRLIKEELGKVEQMLELLRTHPNTDDTASIIRKSRMK